MSLADPRLRIPLRADSQPWNDEALCAQTSPEHFFPEAGEANGQAKAVCAACSVRVECLTYALDNDEQHGIWGGTTAYERKRMRRAVA